MKANQKLNFFNRRALSRLAVAALVTSALTCGLSAPQAGAENRTSEIPPTTFDERVAALNLLNLASNEQIVGDGKDCDFVADVAARAKLGSSVQKMADIVLGDKSPAFCAFFIRHGVQVAQGMDLEEDSKARTQALAAKQVERLKKEGVIAAGVEVDDVDLKGDLKTFLAAVLKKAPTGSVVAKRTAKALILALKSGADESKVLENWRAEIGGARLADNVKKIFRKLHKYVSSKYKDKLANAKQNVILMAFNRKAHDWEVELPVPEFIEYVKSNSQVGEIVEAADTLDHHEFLFGGAKRANEARVDHAREAHTLSLRRGVEGILQAAHDNGHEPHIVAAAESALKDGTAPKLNLFLTSGRKVAYAADHLTPKDGAVVEFEGPPPSFARTDGPRTCLKTAGATNEGAKAEEAGSELWNCGTAEGKWRLKVFGHYKGDNAYSLINENSDKCLTYAGDGKQLTQSHCYYNINQVWHFRSVGEEAFELFNPDSQAVMTIKDNATAIGTVVLSKVSSEAVGQQWRMLK